MKKVSLLSFLSISLVGMLLLAFSNTTWVKPPQLFAMNSSITFNQPPELSLSNDANGNNIANWNDEITVTVYLSNGDDDMDCVAGGTSVSVDLTAYNNNSSNALNLMECGGGTNQIWSGTFSISMFTEQSGGGLDVSGGDVASQVTVYASDFDESPAASNTTNALGDGVIDTTATSGVDNIRPDVTNISLSDNFLLNGDTELVATLDFSDDMNTSGFPYFSFYWDCDCSISSFNEENSIWLDSDTFEAHFDLQDEDLEQYEVSAEVSPNGETDDAGNVMTLTYFSNFDITLNIDQAEPRVLSAKITGPNTVRVRFTSSVDTEALSLSDFSNFVVDGEESARSFTGMDTEGNPSILLTFAGDPVGEDATGTMDLQNLASIQDVNGNEFETVIGQLVSDGQGVTEFTVDDDFDGDTEGWQVTAFDDVQDALDAAEEGDVVQVNDGFYVGEFSIDKALTLQGDAGDEGPGPGEEAPVLHGDCDLTLGVNADDVTISGVILQGDCEYQNLRINASNVLITDIESRNNYAGIGFTSNATDNTVTNSIFHDLNYGMRIRDEAEDNAISDNQIYDNDYGIYFNDGDEEGVDGTTIVGNNIHDNETANIYIESDFEQDPENPLVIQDNMISDSDCEGIYISYGVSGVHILNNTIADNGGDCDDTGLRTQSVDDIVFHDNLIAGNGYGVYNDSEGDTFDATRNYWGAASGPYQEDENPEGEGDQLNYNVLFDPFYIDAEMTTLNNYSDVDVTDSNSPINLTVPLEQNGGSLNVSSLVDGNSAVLPEVNITANTPVGTFTANIPSGTTVTGADGWDGTINAPTIMANNSVTAPGTVSSVIEIGFGDVELLFDKGVRILIPGQGGKQAGYSRNSVFTEITTVCADDSQATGDALPAGGDCHIDVNADADKVVWTKHFTSFVSYSSSAGGSRWRLESVPSTEEVSSVPVSQQTGGVGGGSFVGTRSAAEETSQHEEILEMSPEDDSFSDVLGHEERESILSLKKQGILHGRADGLFHPEEALNRAEASKLIGILLGIDPGLPQMGDQWFSGYYRALINARVIKSSIAPWTIEYRANFLAFVLKAKGMKLADLPACTDQKYQDVPMLQWYCPVVEYAFQQGWIRDVGNFDPTGVAKRGWAAGVLDRAF